MTKQLILMPAAMFDIIDAVAEDPYTETLNSLIGCEEDHRIRIYRSFNWTTSVRKRDEVDYGNRMARCRVVSIREAFRAYSGKNSHTVTKSIGDAHTHFYPHLLIPSETDVKDALKHMYEEGTSSWTMLLISPRLVVPKGLGTEYREVNRMPVIRMDNEYRNVGLEILLRAFRVDATGYCGEMRISLTKKMFRKYLARTASE